MTVMLQFVMQSYWYKFIAFKLEDIVRCYFTRHSVAQKPLHNHFHRLRCAHCHNWSKLNVMKFTLASFPLNRVCQRWKQQLWPSLPWWVCVGNSFYFHVFTRGVNYNNSYVSSSSCIHRQSVTAMIMLCWLTWRITVTAWFGWSSSCRT